MSGEIEDEILRRVSGLEELSNLLQTVGMLGVLVGERHRCTSEREREREREGRGRGRGTYRFQQREREGREEGEKGEGEVQYIYQFQHTAAITEIHTSFCVIYI